SDFLRCCVGRPMTGGTRVISTGIPPRRPAMSTNPIHDKVCLAILQVVPRLDPRRLRPEAPLVHLEIDSLKIVELTLALEEMFEEPVFLSDWIAGVGHPRQLTLGSLVD